MTISQIIFSIYIYSLIAVYFIALPKIFEKAGHEKWKGYIPYLNLFEWLKVLKQPWWWIFFFIPYFTFAPTSIGMLTEAVAFLMMIVLNVTTARFFAKFSWQDTLKMIFLPHWGLTEIAFGDAKYFGPTDWHNEELIERRKGGDHVALFFSLPVIGHAIVFIMQIIGQKRKKTGKTLVKEWTDAILFAVVAASIIRSFVFEPFTIPTPSMEKDLLVGDYLFVSKMSYGPKLPHTPLSIPFFHNYIPVIGTKSYVEWAKRPYRRLPGFGDVERNDVVVFNFPAGDTAVYHPGVDGLMGHNYYQLVTRYALLRWHSTHPNKPLAEFNKNKKAYFRNERQQLVDEHGLVYRPVDKRENYIKRCTAIAGDEIEIKNSQLYINESKSELLEDMQYDYFIKLDAPLSINTLEVWKERFDITPSQYAEYQVGKKMPVIGLTNKAYTGMVQLYGKDNIVKKNKPKGHYRSIQSQYAYYDSLKLSRDINTISYYPIYPNHPDFDWTEDNFGPLKIPEKGWTIDLTEENWILYKRCIEVYEGNEISEKDGKYFINGKEVTEYTFKMNYYWLMGDNRHQSADSRFWGFVPEDHVVGKAVFIWMSIDPEYGLMKGGIRTDRLFTAID